MIDMTRFQWTHPHALPGELVLFLRRHGEAVEGTIEDVTTEYPDGRASHIYRIRPVGLKNCARVPEGMILFQASPENGAVRYRPTRTPSDSRTDAKTRRTQAHVFKEVFGSGGRDRTYDQLINSDL